MFKHLLSVSLFLTLLSGTAFADDFAPEGEDDITFSANNLTLDGDDTGGNIELQFGATLSETLQWDSANARFSLSDSLNLSDNELINIRIENLVVAPTCGAPEEGKIYFNTTDKLTYSCDGAGVWNPFENALNATIEFPVVQARRTTTYTLTTSYADITFDTTDLENDVTTLDHDGTNTDRINIGATAMYQIIYGYTAGGTATGTHEARARVRVNDTTVLSGSESVNTNYQGEFSTTSASFLANLNDGDFISFQLQRNAVTDTTQDEIFFSIIKLEGIKGDPGITGANGADGADGAPGSVGLGTNENVFTLDQDDTGGDVSLTFGTALSESLTWDNTNGEFDLSDDLNVGGNLLQAGNTLTLDADNAAAGANVSIVAEQGTDNNGEFRYNATTNVWEFSNDGGAFVSLNDPGDGLDDVFYAYDGAGVTLIANTPTDLPFDTEVREDSDYTHAADSAEVTINTTGSYLVDYNCTMDVVGTARYVAEHWIERNTGGGFIEAPGTRSGTYHRTTGDGLDNASIEAYLELNVGDIIKAVAQADTTNVVRTEPNGCRFKIQRLDNANGLIGPQGPTGATGADGTDGVSGGGWGDDGVTTSTALHADITGDLTANSLTVTSECGPYAAYWAERGTVTSNASWALGNGQSPWGSPMGCAGTVQRFSATCTGSIGTSLGAVIRKNNVATACSLTVPTTVGQVASSSCSEAFTANDVVGVYAQTEVGAWTECVGTFWVKYD